MAMEREARAPRPEREHPIGKALYDFQRNGWGVYFQRVLAGNPTPEMREYEKRALLTQLDVVRAQIDAL